MHDISTRANYNFLKVYAQLRGERKPKTKNPYFLLRKRQRWLQGRHVPLNLPSPTDLSHHIKSQDDRTMETLSPPPLMTVASARGAMPKPSGFVAKIEIIADDGVLFVNCGEGGTAKQTST